MSHLFSWEEEGGLGKIHMQAARRGCPSLLFFRPSDKATAEAIIGERGEGEEGGICGRGEEEEQTQLREKERNQEQDLFNDLRWLTLNNFAELTFG